MKREGWHDLLVRMPDELHDAVKAKAASAERSMAQEIRYALRLHCGVSERDPQ